MSRSNARGTDDAILDATAELIVHLGVRRTQLSEIARRAGVSRPTVYRRWPDVRAVIGALLTREILHAVGERPTDDERATLVDWIVAVAVRLREHAVIGALVRSDPDILTEYVFERLGASQRGLLQVLSEHISRSRRHGSVRAGEPDELAAMILLIVQSAIQSRRLVTDLLPDAAWQRELTLVLNGYLAP